MSLKYHFDTDKIVSQFARAYLTPGVQSGVISLRVGDRTLPNGAPKTYGVGSLDLKWRNIDQLNPAASEVVHRMATHAVARAQGLAKALPAVTGQAATGPVAVAPGAPETVAAVGGKVTGKIKKRKQAPGEPLQKAWEFGSKHALAQARGRWDGSEYGVRTSRVAREAQQHLHLAQGHLESGRMDMVHQHVARFHRLMDAALEDGGHTPALTKAFQVASAMLQKSVTAEAPAYDRVVSAAIKLHKNGRVVSGAPMHTDVVDLAHEQGHLSAAEVDDHMAGRTRHWENGFVTQSGKFLDRVQALAHTKGTPQQTTRETARDYDSYDLNKGPKPGRESDSTAMMGKKISRDQKAEEAYRAKHSTASPLAQRAIEREARPDRIHGMVRQATQRLSAVHQRVRGLPEGIAAQAHLTAAREHLQAGRVDHAHQSLTRMHYLLDQTQEKYGAQARGRSIVPPKGEWALKALENNAESPTGAFDRARNLLKNL